MKLEHIAIWTNQLDVMKAFYCKYFNGISGQKYSNEVKHFESYFISFDSGARVELMTKMNLEKSFMPAVGIAHLAFSVGSKEEVDRLTEVIKRDGYQTTQPRTTGDGYYESTIKDPDGNIIEITI
ncbi:glyoxalase/bleomycin resistance/extradiol dioxygenase family protein [Acidaminobacter sp. JC074]|uniref:VOC family protein n=1 Tax=Acidaminobacter sp. JC074 TaxID=2530199 RepID=UPI001F10C8BB|nr:VOC family protein [Acidaminobacter sp. JC074]MCH4886852.1 glyoxalase/bleomycin resistance/extradiol dioxygenase family protein [Acidaminobacter sp. JC074]